MLSGFELPGALWMALACSVPILLHIRFRKKIIQVIPSLNLFQLNRKRRRRFWLENFLLLLSRMIMIASVVLMLSQPFWLTLEKHPFYDMIGSLQEGPSLAILLDDRSVSRHGQHDEERLEKSLAWVDAQLRELPEGSKVCLATPTYARVSKWMSPSQARERLKHFNPSSEAKGSAGKALSALYDKIRGHWGSVLVAAPMDYETWHESDESLRQPAGIPLHLFDTSTWKTPVVLRSAEEVKGDTNQNAVDFEIIVQGNEEALLNASVELHQNGVMIQSRNLEDIREQSGRLRVSVPRLDQVSALEFRLQGGGERVLPWSSTFTTLPARNKEFPSRWVLLGRGEDIPFEEKLLMNLLEMVSQERPWTRFDLLNEDPSTYGEASRVILMGTHNLARTHLDWLKTRLKNGAQVLCLAPVLPPPSNAQPTDDLLPVFGAWSQRAPGEWLPLSLGLRVNDPKLEGLLARGIQSMAGSALVDVKWKKPHQVLLGANHGEPVLSRIRVGAWGWVDAYAVPLLEDPDSVVYHPMFPLLLRHLLFQESTARLVRGLDTPTGRQVRADLWFDQPMMQGSWIQPDGDALAMSIQPGRSAWCTPNQPGIHRFSGEQVEVLASANEKRPPLERAMDNAYWESLFPLFKLRQHDPKSLIGKEEHTHITDDLDSIDRHQYDLSILAAFAALAFFILETLFTWLAWLRWKKGYQ